MGTIVQPQALPEGGPKLNSKLSSISASAGATNAANSSSLMRLSILQMVRSYEMQQDLNVLQGKLGMEEANSAKWSMLKQAQGQMVAAITSMVGSGLSLGVTAVGSIASRSNSKIKEQDNIIKEKTASEQAILKAEANPALAAGPNPAAGAQQLTSKEALNKFKAKGTLTDVDGAPLPVKTDEKGAIVRDDKQQRREALAGSMDPKDRESALTHVREEKRTAETTKNTLENHQYQKMMVWTNVARSLQELLSSGGQIGDAEKKVEAAEWEKFKATYSSALDQTRTGNQTATSLVEAARAALQAALELGSALYRNFQGG